MDSELWLSRFEDYARSYRRSESTIQGYLVELRRFLAFLEQRGLKQPHELTAADVEAYQVSLEHWRKPNGEMLTVQSKNYRMSSVRTFVKYLRRAGVLMTDPTADLVRPRPPQRLLPELPTEDEVVRLLEEPDVTTPLGLRTVRSWRCSIRARSETESFGRWKSVMSTLPGCSFESSVERAESRVTSR